MLSLALGVLRRFLASNEHVVEAGRAFRVARGHLPDAALAALLLRRRVRTVIDLRDPRSSASDMESVDFAALGVRFHNIHLRASVLAPPESVEAFVRLVTTPGEGPFLFICKRGKDKTGFASALYRATVAGDRLADAWGSQLRFVPFGHRSRTHPGPWSFRALFEESGASDLRAWCLDGYRNAYLTATAARARALRTARETSATVPPSAALASSEA